MARMLLYGFLVLGSFGLAAGGSWFMSQKAEDKDEQKEGEGDENAADSDAAAQEATPEDMASAIHPRSMSAEDLYRIGEVMKSREDAIKRREAKLEAEDRRMKLVLMDIDAEQREADGLFTQVRGTLDSAAEMLRAVQDVRDQPVETTTTEENPPTEPEKMKVPDAGEMKNIKRWASIYQGMEPEKAATLLTKMANEGQIDSVVWIISQFDERKASMVLAAIPDEDLVNQLAEKSRSLRHPEKRK